MANISGIKTVWEVFEAELVTIIDVPKGGRPRRIHLDKDREYIVPGYQREIRLSTTNNSNYVANKIFK